MDEQNVEKCFLFPTLGDGVEGLISDDPSPWPTRLSTPTTCGWRRTGLRLPGSVCAPPSSRARSRAGRPRSSTSSSTRAPPDSSVRPGPAAGRSPADPVWDPFWARINEAGILAAYHAFGGPTVYQEAFETMWRTSAGHRRALPGHPERRPHRRPGHPRHHHCPRAGQPLRAVPRRPGGEHRDGLQLGALRPPRARPRRRFARPPRRGVRSPTSRTSHRRSSTSTSTCRRSPRRTWSA